MKVIISAPAQNDLSDLYDFLKREAGVRVARAFIADLYERFSGLKRMPQRYALLPEFENAGYRKRVYRDYLIIYRIGDQRIDVIRVIHGASDYQKLLEQGG